MTLTNQELVNELKKRIKEGTLNMQITAEPETETSSLLSSLGNKDKLTLVGLAVLFILATCYAVKLTTTKASSCEVEFDCNPSDKLAVELNKN